MSKEETYHQYNEFSLYFWKKQPKSGANGDDCKSLKMMLGANAIV